MIWQNCHCLLIDLELVQRSHCTKIGMLSVWWRCSESESSACSLWYLIKSHVPMLSTQIWGGISAIKNIWYCIIVSLSPQRCTILVCSASWYFDMWLLCHYTHLVELCFPIRSAFVNLVGECFSIISLSSNISVSCKSIASSLFRLS
jgi:hypothetical protein